MKPPVVTSLLVGQRVVVLDAYGKLRPGEVRPVPRNDRDHTRSQVVTTRGAFPKVWVRLADGYSGEAVPWPIEDVFTDLAVAEAAQKERNDRALTDDQADPAPVSNGPDSTSGGEA